MHCLRAGSSRPALRVQSYLQWKSKTASLGQEPRAARGQKPPRDLIVRPGLLCNTACAQRENSRLNSVANFFFVPRRPRSDCVYGTRAGTPINAVSGSFTQLLTFLSMAQEGAVGSSSVVTGFIKPSDVFQPCPRLDTEVKRRERSTREERAGCRRSVRDQPPGDAAATQSHGRRSSPVACGGPGLCQLWLFPLAGAEAPSQSRLPRQMPPALSCWLRGRQSPAPEHLPS